MFHACSKDFWSMMEYGVDVDVDVDAAADVDVEAGADGYANGADNSHGNSSKSLRSGLDGRLCANQAGPCLL
jgi:hypothetical protein